MIKKLFLFLFAFIFLNTNLDAAEQQFITEVKPLYQLSNALDIGYFNPLGYYSNLLNPGYHINYHFIYHPKWFDFFLFHLETGFILTNFKNNPSTNYYFIPIGLLAHYQIPILKDLSLYARLGGGHYFLSIKDEWFNNFYSKASLGLIYEITFNLNLSIGQDIYYINDSQKPMWATSTNVSFQYNFGDPISQKDIQIISLDYEKLFAALYPYYYKENIGTIYLKNISGEDLKNIKVSLFIKDFMDSPTISKIQPPQLKNNQNFSIPIYVFFPHKIKYLNSDTETTGTIEIEYEKKNLRKFRKKEQIKIKIYNKNAVIWDQFSKIGSFSTVKDQSIIDFARKILKSYQQKESQANNTNLSTLIKIIEGLKAYSLSYVKDPNSPYEYFSKQKAAADYIQYPRETLIKKTGDCDDLTVMTAALLESAGINTAYVSVPGHIFLLAEIDDYPISDKLVSYNNKKWLPIETTSLQDGFYTAWKKGLDHFKNSTEKEIKLLSETIRIYPPILFDEILDIPFSYTNLDDRYLKEISKAIELLVANDSEDPFKLSAYELNEKALNFSKAKHYALAEKYYLYAIKKDPKFKNSYYNLVILYKEQNEFEKALELFKEFDKIYKNDPQMKELFEEIKNEKDDKGFLIR